MSGPRNSTLGSEEDVRLDVSAATASRRDDVDLLESWAAGDNLAGSVLFDRHVDLLQRFFARRVPEVADDLVQSTLLACIEGRERLRGTASFKAYLLGIAKHQLFGHYRRRSSERARRRDNTTSRFHVGASPSTVALRRSEDDAVRTVLRTLPLSMQLILELKYWEDLSPVELAEVLNVPVNAVHARLHRAKERLREGLAERDGRRA